VDAYNDLAEFVDTQLQPPPEGQAPPPLYNDSVLRTMRTTLRGGLGTVLDATVTGGPARLLDIGIEIDKQGRYTVDAAKLQDAVDNHGEAVARLFGVYGTASGTGLTYLSGTDKTQHGTYAVAITQLAQAAAITGAGFGAAYIDDATADRLNVRDVLNGRTYSISLAHGMTMSQIVSALNAEFGTAKTHVMAAGHALTDGTGAAVTDATAWADVHFPPGSNAGIAAGDVITISGTRPDGAAFAKSISVGAAGTLGELRAAAQTALGPDVEVLWSNGVLTARTRTAGSQTFTLDVTSNNAGGGTFDLGGFTVTQQGRGTAGITASAVGGQLRLVHDEYGTAAGFEVSFSPGGADGSASLGFAAGTYTGVDVAGTIGGFAATGAGRLLTGDAGTAVQGLIVAYEGAATGAAGSVTFSRGIGSRLERLTDELLGSAAGSIGGVTGRIESSITLMLDRVEALESRLERRRAQLIKRFSAMERAMSLAQSQSAWLDSQVRQLQSLQSA
jgi:flagellar hook-associated protein 2